MGIKVSIITPVYNGLPYLGTCVSSVLAQTLKEFELIIVDDGSTDGSGTLADTFACIDPRVKVIHQKNAGVSAARNAALYIARGEFIGFVDADDFIDPELYKSMVSAAIENKADIVNSGISAFSQAENTVEVSPPPFEPGRVFEKEDILRRAITMHTSGCFLYIWRNLYSRRLIEENGIRFDEGIAVGEDTLFCMECFLKAERAVGLDLAAYHYRIHPASCMRQKYKPLLTVSLQKQFEKKMSLCETFLGGNKADYCRDMAGYTLKALLPVLLTNIYLNDVPDKRAEMKSILKSDMLQQAFTNYNIADFRSKSLDWLMLWLAKNKLYTAAYLLCNYLLYKTP